MKNKLILILLFSSFTIAAFAKPKEIATKTNIKVWGLCDMCKKRIEKAAKITGVKTAIWSEETHLLSLSFYPSKTTIDQVQKNIASAGYDTEKYTGDNNIYSKLPECCQYERKK